MPTDQPLCLVSLNLQYFQSWPKDDEPAARARLGEALSGADVVCVQEGLEGRMGVLEELGFQLVVSALESSDSGELTAQSLRDMVYNDATVGSKMPPEAMEQRLMNEVYVRSSGSAWKVVESGRHRIASETRLNGDGGRVDGLLATRSVVWVKLQPLDTSADSPAVHVLNTHLTGGRFEDQYFLQSLAQERRQQIPEAMRDFKKSAGARDVGILVGDYNATPAYAPEGPMHSYFKFGIAGSAGVQKDAAAQKLDEAAVEEKFKEYMTSPFKALEAEKWELAYLESDLDGPTSGFGHCIDHMATTGAVKLVDVKVEILTNQMGKPAVAPLVLTDHNAVKATFRCDV